PKTADTWFSESMIDGETRACDDRRRVNRNIPISSSNRLSRMPKHQTGTTAARMNSRTANDDPAAGTVAVATRAPGSVTALMETSTTVPRPDAAAEDEGRLHDGV